MFITSSACCKWSRRLSSCGLHLRRVQVGVHDVERMLLDRCDAPLAAHSRAQLRGEPCILDSVLVSLSV